MAEFDPSVRVHQCSRTAARVIEGRAVVVVIDDNMLHTLNPTGTALWERCTGATVGDLATWLAGEYGIPDSDAKRDVDAFVQKMRDVGAIELGQA